MEIMCLCLLKEKKYEKNIVFCIHKVTEERSRIRSWIMTRIRIRNRIWINLSEVRNWGSGSALKCHGSPTLVTTSEKFRGRFPFHNTSFLRHGSGCRIVICCNYGYISAVLWFRNYLFRFRFRLWKSVGPGSRSRTLVSWELDLDAG